MKRREIVVLEIFGKGVLWKANEFRFPFFISQIGNVTRKTDEDFSFWKTVYCGLDHGFIREMFVKNDPYLEADSRRCLRLGQLFHIIDARRDAVAKPSLIVK